MRDEHERLLFSFRRKERSGRQIQYDFFHVAQNIHRHLYKALTADRKAF